MKKIIFIFLTLFVFIPNSKALSKFYISEKIPDMYIESINGENSYNNVPFIIKRDDGEFVYCLNHQQQINTTDYYNEYTYNDDIFNITDEQLNRINLIAYYGYQYSNHTDIKWYGVTQFLIWKTLNNNIYFTDKEGNKISAYEEEVNEIETLVKKHLTLPNFANYTFEKTINDISNLSDYNKVFTNYEVKSSDIDFYMYNDYGYVTSKDEGNYEINFIRKSPIERDYILYELNDSGSLIYPGKVNDMEFKVNFVVTSGSITINKKDSENTDRKFASLEGAEYEIYSDNKLITTIKTDENGVGVVDNIPWGKKYTIKELTASKGYKLNENSYEISLTKKNKNSVINLEESVIKGNLIINKYYGKNNNYKLENGATFEVYDINDNLIGAYETENGIIKTKLEYGEYYVIQTKGVSGYNLVNRFDISITEEKDYIIDLYNEKEEILIVEVPNTKKYDYKIFIPFIFIILGIVLVLKAIKKTTH